ncbi:MAG: flagellar FliL protein [Rhodospirillaceae bacterium]|nr:MAG: flagellar FliL protein [Rhodospirillaceae bacterium]
MAKELDEELDNGVVSGGEEERRPARGSGKMKKLILFVVVPVVLVILLVVGVLVSGIAGSVFASRDGQEEMAADTELPSGRAGSGVVAIHDLPEMLVNLSGRKKQYLKLKVALELSRIEDKAKIESYNPRIIDSFQVYLRELRVEDLQGSAGMYRLHEELLSRVNAAIAPMRVANLLFKEMLVQ